MTRITALRLKSWTNPKDGWRVRQKVWRTGSRPTLDPVSPCVGDGSWLYNLRQTLRNVVKRKSPDKCFLFRKCSPLGVSRPAVYCAYTGRRPFAAVGWFTQCRLINFTERWNGRNQLTKTCCHTDFCGLCLGNILRSLRWTDEDFHWNTAHWPAWPKLLNVFFAIIHVIEYSDMNISVLLYFEVKPLDS